jgi:phosphoenolpyruvate synthase/pyruvate phosphate dikinase
MSYESMIIPFDRADANEIERLGAKGAKLVEDRQHIKEVFHGMEDKIAVPDGFILTTDFWRLYHQNGDRLAGEHFAGVLAALQVLENRRGCRLGEHSGTAPFILAVRGGAPISMPGVLGTILNVGLNDEIAASLIAAGEDESFVLTTYLTCIRMYGEIVLNIQYDHFYNLIKRLGAGDEGTLSIPLLRELMVAFKDVLAEAWHPKFPPGFATNIEKQLGYAVEAVMDSWMSPPAFEARLSRRVEEGGVPDDMGTAVVIQEMVFGNRDEKNCLSGVMFTRDQRTGVNSPHIEWAPKVQCDKIVSGKLRKQLFQTKDLQERFPDIYERLLMVKDVFESRAKRPLDIEFTVDNRKLYLLQRRPLRMTSNAALRTMWDFVDEGKTSIQLASMIINTALEQAEKTLSCDFFDYEILARGEPITDTADTGILAFGTDSAVALADQGEDVIMLCRRPFGETEAVNHPQVRGIVRSEGNTTGHEAVSAVAYNKPYLIHLADVSGQPVLLRHGDEFILNPESKLSHYIGRRVFVDGERGIVGYTEATEFLEDRRARKKLYVDWEYLRDQFNDDAYDKRDYEELLDLHYQWELELDRYQHLEKRLRDQDPSVTQQELLQTFSSFLRFIPERHRESVLWYKEVRADDFVFGRELVYRGGQLDREVRKVLRALMLCTTWRTHWVHELMVRQARARGETENDVIRDIFLKNHTMSTLQEFKEEGFHVIQVGDFSHLIFASNFEYGQDLDKLQIGPNSLGFAEKEILAQQFLSYLEQVNPRLQIKVRMIQGEPFLGPGHQRIISIGLAVPNQEFYLVCRYLRTFLDQCKHGCPLDLQGLIPQGEYLELYQLDPFFAPYPEFEITREVGTSGPTGDFLLAFGKCSFGEFDGTFYGKDEYDKLIASVKSFQLFLERKGKQLSFRPWQFEIDPFRRHSVIAAYGIRFSKEIFSEVLNSLKGFVEELSS